MKILQLADTHLAATGVLHYGLVDTAQCLRDVLAAVPADFEPDVVVVCGDVSNDDTAESYDLGLQIVGDWAGGRGIPVVWAPGNHDQSEHYDRLHRPDGPVRHVAHGMLEVAGGAIDVVDTRVSRRGHGVLPAQTGDALAALAGVEGDRVLVMHHPPLPAPTALHHALRLRGTQEWADRVAAVAPAVVLSGHYHLAGIGQWAGSPVVVAPAIANQTLPGVEWGTEVSVARHGAALVDTADPSATRFVRLAVDEPPVVLRMDAERVAAVARAAGAADEPEGGLDRTGAAERAAQWWRDGGGVES